ncbi:tubulin folding cofactor B [Tieghemostelium lacteum]|uniref:Tubulin folding cofactor B n=1 Tax=Tieghemostelium lacteum TaxID=361077 RepID=A0A151ZA98_TIELA|nr:tubulin folding cofactor B [Tieghemostelium lacteum]|eukprot:KYQ90814.1 tubulin folding cofactor B [Tieghemostelium lacteum]
MQNLSSDELALRSYILGTEEQNIHKQKAPEGNVRLEITHSVLSDQLLGANNFKNFPLTLSIKEFKEKLHRFAGTDTKWMHLQFRSGPDRDIIKDIDLNQEESVTLDSLSLVDGMNIHIIDKDPNQYIMELVDTSKAEKVKMSDAEYDLRENTVKKQLEKQKLEQQQLKEQQEISDNQEPSHLKVGEKCLVKSDDSSTRLGIIAFIGQTEFSSGYWVGVILNQPLGKNDGSVKGKSYFSCQPNYGCFVRARNILQNQENLVVEQEL